MALKKFDEPSHQVHFRSGRWLLSEDDDGLVPYDTRLLRFPTRVDEFFSLLHPQMGERMHGCRCIVYVVVYPVFSSGRSVNIESVRQKTITSWNSGIETACSMDTLSTEGDW